MCVLFRGLRNLEASLKGFNCCGAKLRLRRADSRFAKPRSFPERERFYSFCVVQKVTTRSPSQGASRFCKPRISPPQTQLRTATIKTFYKGSFEVPQTSKQHTQTTNSCNPIKSFRRPLAASFRQSPTNKNLPPATFCTSEQLFSAFCKKQKKLWHFLPKCDILQKIS